MGSKNHLSGAASRSNPIPLLMINIYYTTRRSFHVTFFFHENHGGNRNRRQKRNLTQTTVKNNNVNKAKKTKNEIWQALEAQFRANLLPITLSFI